MNDNTDNFENELHEYITAGLGEFEQFDNIPITLKAMLFNRFGYWFDGTMLESIEPFQKDYINIIREKNNFSLFL